MKELVGPKINLVDFKDAAVEEGPEDLTLRIEERRGQKALVDTTRIDGNRWGPPLVRSVPNVV